MSRRPVVAGQPRAPHLLTVRTAGALVWRIRDGRLQVQVVHRPRYNDWSWPKGKLDTGETHQAAAIREVAEETGHAIVLGTPLPGTRYRLPTGGWKTVAYWAARRAHGKADLGPLIARDVVVPASTEEIDRVRWIDAAEAATRLTRSTDVAPLNALTEAYEAGRLTTHVVIIARHGKAVPRSVWHESESNRPLTPIGHAHAAALVPVLAAYGVARVVSSRWERCAATVEPYVRAANLRPWFSDNLTETSHEREPTRVAATVREMLAASTSAVLCTHRPVLPTVFEVIRDASRKGVAAGLPQRDPYLNPGELLVAHVSATGKGPRVVALEHVVPQVY